MLKSHPMSTHLQRAFSGDSHQGLHVLLEAPAPHAGKAGKCVRKCGKWAYGPDIHLR